jgi:hypothetical protein
MMKYTLIERVCEGEEKAKPSIPLQERVSPPTTLHPKDQKLVEFIFSKMKKGKTMSALNNKFTDEYTDVDRQFFALGLAEATPLDHESDEFKKLQHYYHQSHPGATRADDVSGTGYSATIVEDIFRITRKAEMEAFAAVELNNAVDARKRLSMASKLQLELSRDLESGFKNCTRTVRREWTCVGGRDIGTLRMSRGKAGSSVNRHRAMIRLCCCFVKPRLMARCML